MNKDTNKENVVTVITYIIVILVILCVIFIAFMSNKSLLSNKSGDISKDNNSKAIYELKTSTNNNSTSKSTNINSQENMNKKDDLNSSSITDSSKSSDNSSKLDNSNTAENNTPETAIPKETQKPPVETQIATYTTTLYDKEKTRIENINLAISKLNGVIIENGAEFSFNNTIGPMDEKSGFKKATGFDGNGKKIKISGGGICQISSTLYNCALISGFQITERHPHSRRVYYVPKDKDATILYSSLDLKFINNSGSKVRIDASCTDSTVTITLIKIT